MNAAEAREGAITDVRTARIGETFEWTLVRIETDAGVSGIGEAVLGPTADRYIEFAKHRIIGKNPVDIDARLTELYDGLCYLGTTGGIGVTAVSGIDIALHDLAGKLLGVPAHTLLGGKHREEVRLYCDVHAGEHLHEARDGPADTYRPDAYAEAASRVVDEGWDAIKFDLDTPDRHEIDPRNKHMNQRAIDYRVEIVEAVLDAVGDRADVAFDCHWKYAPETARRLAVALEPYAVWWLEDLVPPDNLEIQTEVTRATDTPIAAGENVYRVDGARRLLAEHGIDILHPDVPKTGGMRVTKTVADLAKASHVPLALHNVASPVGTMASAHVAAACSNFLALEYHARDVDWWHDVIEEDVFAPGTITVPDAPGLGVTLDHDVVTDHLVEGQDPFPEN